MERALSLSGTSSHLTSIHLGSDERQEQALQLASIHLSLSEKTQKQELYFGFSLKNPEKSPNKYHKSVKVITLSI
jgi:hypothetical protein